MGKERKSIVAAHESRIIPNDVFIWRVLPELSVSRVDARYYEIYSDDAGSRRLSVDYDRKC